MVGAIRSLGSLKSVRSIYIDIDSIDSVLMLRFSGSVRLSHQRVVIRFVDLEVISCNIGGND